MMNRTSSDPPERRTPSAPAGRRARAWTALAIIIVAALMGASLYTALDRTVDADTGSAAVSPTPDHGPWPTPSAPGESKTDAGTTDVTKIADVEDIPKSVESRHLKLTIVDERGQAQPSARVRVYGSPIDDGTVPVSDDLADRQGDVTVFLPRRDCMVSAITADEQLGVFWHPRLDWDHLTDHVSLVVQPSSVIQGLVLDREGHPVGDAIVELGHTPNDGDFRPSPPKRGVPTRIQTRPGGRFRLEFFGNFFGHVRALVDGEATLPVPCRGAPGETRDRVLRVPGHFVIAGEVRTEDGTAPRVTEVIASRSAGQRVSWSAQRSGEMEDDGSRFRILVDGPGEYSVSIRAEHLVQGSAVHAALDEETPIREVVVPFIDGWSLSGSVHRPSGTSGPGEPIEGAVVQAVPDDSHDPFEAWGALWSQSESDASGRFLLTNLHPSFSYQLFITAPDRGGWIRDKGPHTQSSGDARITLPRPEDRPGEALESWILHGRVVDAETGDPVTRFEVSTHLQRNGRVSRIAAALDGTSTTLWVDDPDGLFAFGEKALRSPTTVYVRAPGWASGGARAIPQSLPVTVRLYRPATLEVHVVSTGRPVPDETSILLRADHDLLAPMSAGVYRRTLNGVARFEGLGAEGFLLYCSEPGWTGQTSMGRLEPGEHRVVELEVSPQD